MKFPRLWLALIIAFVFAGTGGCSSMGSSAMNMVDQLGGMGQVSKLASSTISSLASNPSTAGLVGKLGNPATISKMADQLCAMLGGGCKAPFTNEQIASAASKLSPEQKAAVSSSFDSALKSVASSPTVREAVNKTLGSRMSGVVGALL